MLVLLKGFLFGLPLNHQLMNKIWVGEQQEPAAGKNNPAFLFPGIFYKKANKHQYEQPVKRR